MVQPANRPGFGRVGEIDFDAARETGLQKSEKPICHPRETRSQNALPAPSAAEDAPRPKSGFAANPGSYEMDRWVSSACGAMLAMRSGSASDVAFDASLGA